MNDGIAERDAIRAALAAAGTGTWRWTIATGVVDWDATLEALCGLAPGEFGRTFDAWRESVHPDERDTIMAIVQGALDRRSPYQFEHRTIWPDGSVHWIECRGEVLVDAEGLPAGTVGTAVDITDRKIAEQNQAALLQEVSGSADRLRRLQRISRRLTAALTADDVIAVVSDSLDPPLGATAKAIWLLDETTGGLDLVSSSGLHPGAAEQFERIDPESDLPGALAFREQRTMISPSQADSIGRFPELADVPRSGQGFIAVPLVAQNVALGILAFGYDGRLEDPDVAYLEAAAGNIAQTLQRVRLADALQRRSDEIAFLAEITRATISATDHRDLMQRIADTAVPRLGDICTIHFIPEPGLPVEAVVAHADPRAAASAGVLAERFPYDPEGERGVARVLRTGEPEFFARLTPELLEDAAHRSGELDEEVARAIDDLDLASCITVPMTSDRRVIGALQVLAGRDHELGERDVALVRAVANAIADALAGRWLTDQHRHISTTLQRAFLPPVLPELPGVEVAADYWPAGAASEIGGDFYDLFKIGDCQWAILIGDACGTGPDAAATAAIARHTARAAARHGLDHHQVLEWVNQAVKHSDRNLFCTACYATVRILPDSGSVEIATASAGHPLPIAVHPSQVTPLGEPGTLLGVVDEPTFHVNHHTIRPGEAVVFYTDGITDLPPPHGLTESELQKLLGALAAATPLEIIDVLHRDLQRRTPANRHADDAAILVIQHTK